MAYNMFSTHNAMNVHACEYYCNTQKSLVPSVVFFARNVRIVLVTVTQKKRNVHASIMRMNGICASGILIAITISDWYHAEVLA